jgi:hypothetical protein
MSSIFHSGTFWVGLLVVALIVAAKVVISAFRHGKKKKQSIPLVPPSQGAKWQPPKLPKFLQFLRSSTAPKQQDKPPIANVDTNPIKLGDIGSRVPAWDAELVRVKQALRGNTEASQLELGLITRLTDEVEEIKKVLVQWGLLGEPPAEKEPESDKERDAREWREALAEQVDIWKDAGNAGAANAEEPVNAVKIAPPRLDTTSVGAQIHARLEKEALATSQLPTSVPVDGKGLKDTLKELRRLNPSITKEEATATLLKQGFDFKGKSPDLMVRLPWANLVREESNAEP